MIASNLDLLLPPALIQACDLGADTDAVKSRIEQAKQAERDEIASTAAKEEARTTAVSAALVAGKSAFASQEYEEAERQFGIALINNAENRVDVLCNRAACSLKLKRYADAQADAAEAINFEPSSVKAHYRLACAYQGWGKLDSALRVCRAALELNPLSTQLTKMLAELEEAEKSAAHSQPTPPAATGTNHDGKSTSTAKSSNKPKTTATLEPLSDADAALAMLAASGAQIGGSGKQFNFQSAANYSDAPVDVS